MDRRNFLLTASALAVTPSVSFAKNLDSSSKNFSQKHRIFDLSFKHELKEDGKVKRLWLPLILGTNFQSIISEIKNSGDYDEIVLSDFENPTLYAKFSGNKGTLTTNFRVLTSERNTDFSKVNFNENEKLSPEVEQFLRPTTHIETDGVVKEKADEIVKGISGDLERARAIYNWVADNMSRDESVIGCGIGNAKLILSSGKLYGKCTDISSVFVALCRAVKIPAREMFGIRVGESRFSPAMGSGKDGVATITGAQHCRAEFYLKGHGWIPCDPADVTKVRLAKNLTNDDAKIKSIKEYLFGNWEMCWVGFNYGRDFVLKPEPYEKPLNNFGYPYAEVDDGVLNYYNPKTFAYEYSSKEIKA